jgi:hypothetical protein
LLCLLLKKFIYQGQQEKGHFISFSIQKRTASLLFLFLRAWQRPTLTGGNPQLPSALKSLTSVFGMGTGVTSLPSSPDNMQLIRKNVILSKLNNV